MSTTLGIPICHAATPNLEGIGGFFLIDTPRNVLFHLDKQANTLYRFRGGAGCEKCTVLLMGDATFKARCGDIEAAIGAKEIILEQRARRLELVGNEDEDEAGNERDEGSHQTRP